MKLLNKIISIFLLFVMLITCLLPVVVFADSEEEVTNATENSENSDKKYCTIEFSLKDFDSDETNNITFRLRNKSGGESCDIVFTKDNNWKVTQRVEVGTYKIDFRFADNQREIQLKNNVLEVQEGGEFVSFQVKKVLNNNFFPKFFRNNTFTLILLTISVVAYYILKKRREAGLM